jgi:hypothetical protein
MPNPSDSSDSGPSRLIAAVLLLLLAAGVVAIVAFLLFMHVVTGD